MVFADKGVWFALYEKSDANHRRARAWFARNREPLLTTDYVVDETLSLFKYRGHARRALLVGEDMWGPSPIASVYHVSRSDVAAAWGVFRKFADKDWSFTDCVSKVVMEKLGLTTAFAFDQHFRQFGSVRVVPTRWHRAGILGATGVRVG
jgi:hypothetical protein